MRGRKKVPVALTIAGSDSGGGAGIQADLKTFAALGVHGTTAITCLTAQNPRAISGLQPCSPEMLRRQLDAVFSELPPAACKTGMLFSAGLTRVVVDFFKSGKRPPLIVDPVMTATSGSRLLLPSAARVVIEELLPLATLVTPNLDEVERLLGRKSKSEEDMRVAARKLWNRFGCAALVKGGHLAGMNEAVDIFYDGKTELRLSAPFINGSSTHGTGCAYSAAITAFCALGFALPEAVRRAKRFITKAIAQRVRVAGQAVLNCSWQA